MVNIIQKMPINDMLNLKTRFERKRSVWIKWNGVYLGTMFFKVHAWIFCETDLFPGTFNRFLLHDVYRRFDEWFSTYFDPCL